MVDAFGIFGAVAIRQGKSPCKLALVTTYVFSFEIDRRDHKKEILRSAKKNIAWFGQGDPGGVTPRIYGQRKIFVFKPSQNWYQSKDL